MTLRIVFFWIVFWGLNSIIYALLVGKLPNFLSSRWNLNKLPKGIIKFITYLFFMFLVIGVTFLLSETTNLKFTQFVDKKSNFNNSDRFYKKEINDDMLYFSTELIVFNELCKQKEKQLIDKIHKYELERKTNKWRNSLDNTEEAYLSELNKKSNKRNRLVGILMNIGIGIVFFIIGNFTLIKTKNNA